MIAEKSTPGQGELDHSAHVPTDPFEQADFALHRIGTMAQAMAQAHFGRGIRTVVMLVQPDDDASRVFVGSTLLRARTIEIFNACGQGLDPRPAALRDTAERAGSLYLKAVDD